jgi:FkbM family methyltransferase
MLPSLIHEDRSALEAKARQQCQSMYIGNQLVLCRVLGKYVMYADADDISLMPRLCLDGFWESWVTIAMTRLLRPGWHCVDVGANHGYYTLIMADAVERDGRVLAVEPNPRLAEILSLNIEVNGFQSHAAVLQKAVTGTDAQKNNLVIPLRRKGDATLCQPATAADKVVEVETVTLDSALAAWPRVDLIKIDAEGSEAVIWPAMQRTVERNREITIIMELTCPRYADPRAFLQEIQRAGFRLRYIDYDASIQSVTQEQLLTDRSKEYWMLFLRRD